MLTILTKDQYMSGLKSDNLRLFKLLGKNYTNKGGFVYKEGVNTDHIPFNPVGFCQPGGLYFFNEIQLINWHSYFGDPHFIGEVELLDNSKVYLEKDKQKTDKFLLKNIKPWSGILSDYIDFKKEKICKLAIIISQRNGWVLKTIPEKYRTKEVCEMAVRNYSYALQWVPERYITEDLCRMAVQKCGYSLKYVPEKYCTQDLCRMGVQQNRYALQYVPKKYCAEDFCENQRVFDMELLS